MTMLAILNLPGPRLYRFELDARRAGRLPTEPYLRWVLEDYPARRDHQWDVEIDDGKTILLKLYYEGRNSGSTLYLTALLQAFGFYGPAAVFARHVTQEFLTDLDLPRRLAAIRATGSFGHPASLEPVLLQVGSSQPEVRHEAIIAAAKVADTAASFDPLAAAAAGDPALASVVELCRQRSAALAHGDKPAAVRLALASDDLYEDLCGAITFVYETVTEVLAQRAAPADHRRRATRVLGLTRVRSRTLANVALDIAFDDTAPPGLREACVWLLGRIRAKPAVPALCQLLEVAYPALADAIITALGEIGDPQAIGPLLNHHDDRDGEIRERVETAARGLSDPFTIESYRAWSSGELAIEPNVGYFFFEGTLATDLQRDRLRAIAREGDSDAQREVAFLLGVLGGPQDAKYLRELSRTAQDELTRAVAERGAELATRRSPAQVD